MCLLSTICMLETHPNTLTDTLPSTIELLEEVNHPNLKINLDFLHIWESGASNRQFPSIKAVDTTLPF